MLTEQGMLVPVPPSSGSSLLVSASSRTGAAQQVTRGAQKGTELQAQDSGGLVTADPFGSGPSPVL